MRGYLFRMLAGHDSIQTTQRYVEPSEDDLRKANTTNLNLSTYELFLDVKHQRYNADAGLQLICSYEQK